MIGAVTPFTYTAPPSVARDVLAHVERSEQSLDTFDLSTARKKAGVIIAATTMASAGVGQLANAAFSTSAAFGLGAVLSLGVTVCGLYAVNHVMHGLRDKSMLGGVGAMSFFAGFSAMSVSQSWGPMGHLAVAAGMAVLSGFAFGSNVETNHWGIGTRLDDARRLASKIETYEKQHAELEAHSQQG
jgi:hypothetical protein